MSAKAFKVADALYSSGCLKFGSFKIKSGAISPYYIDLACLLSSPKDFCTVVEAVADEIRRVMASATVDKLASIELKGALLLPNISCQLNLPCVVVRKEEKTYGVTGRTIGTEVVEGEHILFFDDVISEGLAKLEGIKPLETLGAKVENVVVVVDREQGGRENLEKLGYKVQALTKISEIVDALFQTKKISEGQANTILNYVRKGKA
ncbi:MAG: phosphoribosyltransferase family protein [Candidatus Bathyarchaeia archaeon]